MFLLASTGIPATLQIPLVTPLEFRVTRKLTVLDLMTLLYSLNPMSL